MHFFSTTKKEIYDTDVVIGLFEVNFFVIIFRNFIQNYSLKIQNLFVCTLIYFIKISYTDGHKVSTTLFRYFVV
jgi:hypothetical protein